MENHTSTYEKNLVEIYMASQMVIKSINEAMEPVHSLCESIPTIRAASECYHKWLNINKIKAMKQYDSSLLKPYILYHVNKYFHI